MAKQDELYWRLKRLLAKRRLLHNHGEGKRIKDKWCEWAKRRAGK